MVCLIELGPQIGRGSVFNIATRNHEGKAENVSVSALEPWSPGQKLYALSTWPVLPFNAVGERGRRFCDWRWPMWFGSLLLPIVLFYEAPKLSYWADFLYGARDCAQGMKAVSYVL